MGKGGTKKSLLKKLVNTQKRYVFRKEQIDGRNEKLKEYGDSLNLSLDAYRKKLTDMFNSSAEKVNGNNVKDGKHLATAKAKIELICEDLDAMEVDYTEFLDKELMKELKEIDEPEPEIELPPIPGDSPPEPTDDELKSVKKEDHDAILKKINDLEDEAEDDDEDDD